MSRAVFLWALFAVTVCLGGCVLDRSGLGGGGAIDAAARDAATAADASAEVGPDSGLRMDAGLLSEDAGAPSDAGGMDAASLDAGVDAGPLDAGVDSGPPDAGGDAGPPDAGCVDDALMGSPLVVVARPAAGLTFDGDLADWAGADWVSIQAPADWEGSGSPTSGDISARLAAAWSGDALWFAIEVVDDQHTNAQTGFNLWRGDCVQLAFDVAENGGSGYDGTDDFEYGYALSSGSVLLHRWVAPSGAPAPADAAEVVRGSTTVYEIQLAASDLGLATLSQGTSVGFDWLVNEDDGSGDRQGFIEWSSGIGWIKNPGVFGTLQLAGPACP